MGHVAQRRIYAAAGEDEGRRVLIDRLWPRGVSKQRAGVDYWAKNVAPSHELRRWYQHDPEKWPEFKRRYFAELDDNPAGVTELLQQLGKRATLLYSSKEEQFNNAAALREYLGQRARADRE